MLLLKEYIATLYRVSEGLFIMGDVIPRFFECLDLLNLANGSLFSI